MNEVQVNAVCQSLVAQISAAAVALAQKDGEIALLKLRIVELEKPQHSEDK